MDIVRYRQRQYRRLQASMNANSYAREQISSTSANAQDMAHERRIEKELAKETAEEEQANPAERPEPEGRWTRSLTNFWLGILTTLLVLTAWTTNLIAKPLATAFGGSVALIGMAIAFTNYTLNKRKGRIPVLATGVEKHFPSNVLAVLSAGSRENEAIMQSAITNPCKKAVLFLFLGVLTSLRNTEFIWFI